MECVGRCCEQPMPRRRHGSRQGSHLVLAAVVQSREVGRGQTEVLEASGKGRAGLARECAGGCAMCCG